MASRNVYQSADLSSGIERSIQLRQPSSKRCSRSRTTSQAVMPHVDAVYEWGPPPRNSIFMGQTMSASQSEPIGFCTILEDLSQGESVAPYYFSKSTSRRGSDTPSLLSAPTSPSLATSSSSSSSLFNYEESLGQPAASLLPEYSSVDNSIVPPRYSCHLNRPSSNGDKARRVSSTVRGGAVDMDRRRHSLVLCKDTTESCRARTLEPLHEMH